MGAVKDKSVDVSEVIGLTPLVGEVSPGVGNTFSLLYLALSALM